MKKILIAFLIGIVALPLGLAIVMSGETKKPDCASPAPAAAASGPLAPGATSKPVSSAQTQRSSGYRTPDRPDHRGIDLAGPVGTPIYAWADGVVADAGPASGFGHWIVLDHNVNGQILSTVYGHEYADGISVHKGDHVSAGQRIGSIGSDGGSTGPHVHFEVWQGPRLGGGHDVDPTPYLDKGTEPGGGAPAPPRAPPIIGKPGIAPAPSGPELAPTPPTLGSEEHMTVDGVRVMRAIAAKFPQVKQIGGWRPSDPFPDHPSGRAVDAMIPNWDKPDGQQLGAQIEGYFQANAAVFNVEYTLYRQTTKAPGQPPQPMADRGTPTENHFDHVHITVAGHGLYTGQPLGGVPDGGTWGASAAPQPCGAPAGTPGGPLNAAAVPPAFVPWLQQAGSLCPQIKPALLASQDSAESGFSTSAVSGSGAMGPAQFMPGTWATYGRDYDHNGRVSPNDIGDAVMAQGTYMCAIAQKIDGAIAAGKVKVPDGKYGREKLYLAGYNAGEDAVISSGGMPSGSTDYVVQTAPYAEKITAAIPKYESDLSKAA